MSPGYSPCLIKRVCIDKLFFNHLKDFALKNFVLSIRSVCEYRSNILRSIRCAPANAWNNLNLVLIPLLLYVPEHAMLQLLTY